MGGRRRLIGAATILALVAIALLAVGFLAPPAASIDGLPRSISVDGVAYERALLTTFSTTGGRKTVTESVPLTTRPILVRASCRLAVLHTAGANSALSLEMWWTRTGGAGVPDTGGEEHLFCDKGRPDLTGTIGPAWLPGNEVQSLMTWYELPTVADSPSDSPASWAIAVYTAR